MFQKADFKENPSVPSFSEEAQTVVPGIYRHYKQKCYKVVGVALHTETMEELVVYLDEQKRLWTRPVKMFTEQVLLEDGSILPRFQRTAT